MPQPDSATPVVSVPGSTVAPMPEALSIPDASTRLDELVRRTRTGEEHVILTETTPPSPQS